MQDSVLIEGLSVSTTIGVYEWEQNVKQSLVLDLALEWDNQQAGQTDNVELCLNYADVAQSVTKYVESNRFFLIECVAEEVAALIIEHFLVTKMKIKVSKPGAVSNASNVAVVIERPK